MRLDPVYLVAPKPEPPKITTRRAFLFAGATFAAGLTLGGACGYAAGVSTGGGARPGEEPADVALESTGNAELDELRRLAVKAPIEELAEKWLYFVDKFSDDYRADPVLPTGVNRLIDHVIATPSLADRTIIARFIRDCIMRGHPSFRAAFEPRIKELNRFL